MENDRALRDLLVNCLDKHLYSIIHVDENNKKVLADLPELSKDLVLCSARTRVFGFDSYFACPSCGGKFGCVNSSNSSQSDLRLRRGASMACPFCNTLSFKLSAFEKHFNSKFPGYTSFEDGLDHIYSPL